MPIISVVGARPNFMKMAPVISAINNIMLDNLLVNSCQSNARRIAEPRRRVFIKAPNPRKP